MFASSSTSLETGPVTSGKMPARLPDLTCSMGLVERDGGAMDGLGGGGAGWDGSSPENGDWVPLTEVEVPYMRFGDPGPVTRGPRTPGREKAEDEVGGREAVEPRPRDEENWLDREARVSE